ncbi:rac serine-threonine kinase-like protein [Diplonema papillatum]|nr:rac serine-threonine kinase-like protein [Diplonema papillatum]
MMEEDEEQLTHLGMLQKHGGGVIKRHQDRWFELRNGILCYYVSEPLGRLDLAGAKVVVHGSNSWTITGPRLKHPYTLKASSEDDQKLWVAKINRGIRKRNDDSSSQWNKSSNPPADEAASRKGDGGQNASAAGSAPLNSLTGESYLERPAKKRDYFNDYCYSYEPEQPQDLKQKIDDLQRERDQLKEDGDRERADRLKTEEELETVKNSYKTATSLAAGNPSCGGESTLNNNKEGGKGIGSKDTHSEPSVLVNAISYPESEEGSYSKSHLRSAKPGGQQHNKDVSSLGDEDTSDDISARQKDSNATVGGLSAGAAASAAAIVEQMQQQLYFEREEQRTLRADLCQEIDRLQDELRSTHARMQAAEDQAEELLQRAIAASQTMDAPNSPLQTFSHRASPPPTLAAPPVLPPRRQKRHGRSHSWDLPTAGATGNGSSNNTNGHDASVATPMSCLTTSNTTFADFTRPRTSGVFPDVSEGQLQAKLEHKMVQKYIELKKALHDLQQVGIDRIEHCISVTKASENEKLGLSFKKPTNVIRSTAPTLPAARCGLKVGMQIVSVDGVCTPDSDTVLAALCAYKKTFDLVVSEATSELTARVEGNTLLAEERAAILIENDRLREELQSLRSHHGNSNNGASARNSPVSHHTYGSPGSSLGRPHR